MNRAELLANARLAGQVLRYHTWPVHRQQSVGEHTWQVLRIYYQIWGPLPASVTTYILWHDAGELVTGDSPFPFKSSNSSLKAMLDSLEEEAVENMGGNPRVALSDKEKRRAKACDLLEMVEYGLHEHNLGNKYAEPIICDVSKSIGRLWPKDDTFDDPEHRAVIKYLSEISGWAEFQQYVHDRNKAEKEANAEEDARLENGSSKST